SEVSELKTMFSDATPSAFRKPTQNWAVVQMFSTFGIPTRSCERSLTRDATEGFFANQVGNVGKRIFCLLDSGFDDFHFVELLHAPLRAEVVNNHPLPSLAERPFAPLTSLATE